jgi:hypothetical protein
MKKVLFKFAKCFYIRKCNSSHPNDKDMHIKLLQGRSIYYKAGAKIITQIVLVNRIVWTLSYITLAGTPMEIQHFLEISDKKNKVLARIQEPFEKVDFLIVHRG